MKDELERLLPPHGGYRQLKTFQLARLIYDVTVRFCDRYVDRRSRTHDQMVQAARSGTQNIAEGSVDSGTSKKSELFLTNIAKGSLEELQLDYEDYLRQRGLPQWPPQHPALLRFKALRCSTLQGFRAWVGEEHGRTPEGHGQTRGEAGGVGPCTSVSVRVPPPPDEIAANGALSLLNLCLFLLGQQIGQQASDFEQHGGFKERMYRVRSQHRKALS